MQNLTKERKQPPIVTLQQEIFWNTFILHLLLRIVEDPIKAFSSWIFLYRFFFNYIDMVTEKLYWRTIICGYFRLWLLLSIAIMKRCAEHCAQQLHCTTLNCRTSYKLFFVIDYRQKGFRKLIKDIGLTLQHLSKNILFQVSINKNNYKAFCHTTPKICIAKKDGSVKVAEVKRNILEAMNSCSLKTRKSEDLKKARSYSPSPVPLTCNSDGSRWHTARSKLADLEESC